MRRIPKTQSLHDSVISAIANLYRSNGWTVWTNPSQEHNFTVDNVYPDVEIKPQNRNVYYIFEVETEDSVSDAEVAQWKDYSRRFNFHLVVPSGVQSTAQALLKRHALTNVSLATYSINSNGYYYFQGIPQAKETAACR